jgi:hypothetical protein
MNSLANADLHASPPGASETSARLTEGVSRLVSTSRGLRTACRRGAQAKGPRPVYAMSGQARPRRTLPPDEFRALGHVVLGPDWRRELAATLDLDVAMVDGWAEGRSPVPYVIVKTLAGLARLRADELMRISERLTSDLDDWIGEL